MKEVDVQKITVLEGIVEEVSRDIMAWLRK